MRYTTVHKTHICTKLSYEELDLEHKAQVTLYSSVLYITFTSIQCMKVM